MSVPPFLSAQIPARMVMALLRLSLVLIIATLAVDAAPLRWACIKKANSLGWIRKQIPSDTSLGAWDIWQPLKSARTADCKYLLSNTCKLAGSFSDGCTSACKLGGKCIATAGSRGYTCSFSKNAPQNSPCTTCKTKSCRCQAGACINGPKSVTFAVIGDWGLQKDGDYSAPYWKSDDNAALATDALSQVAVGKALGAKCKDVGCKFVVNTGDNFYNLGVSRDLGVHDPQWTTSFSNVYSHPSLRAIKFYGVLGNHDYGRDSSAANHSIIPQIGFTYYDPNGQWTIPSRYYRAVPTGLDLPVSLAAFDTSPFLDNYCTKPSGTYYTPEMVHYCTAPEREAQVQAFSDALEAARADDMWSIAVGHHPLASAIDGEYFPLNKTVAPVMASPFNSPHMWFNGHDHVLTEYTMKAVPYTSFFTVGSSGKGDPVDLPSAASVLKYKFGSASHGFATVTLTEKSAILNFYGVDIKDSNTVSSPSLLHTAHVNKKNVPASAPVPDVPPTPSPVPTPAGATTTFAVIGDWGVQKDGDFSAPDFSASKLATLPDDQAAQVAVGKALGSACQSAGCSFVINTGDNFYNLGISRELGVHDPQWASSFTNIYSASSLKIPFYGVLGNHDYGHDSTFANHSIWPQVGYTFYDPNKQWYLPGRTYTALPNTSVPITISAFDTSPMLDSYCTKPSGSYYTPELLQGCKPEDRDAQLSALQYSLSTARYKDTWSIALGHHPLVSGADGAYSPLSDAVSPILASASPQLWFNGHDHVLAHATNPAAPRVNFFTVGSSGKVEKAGSVAINSTAATYDFYAPTHGFGIVTLNATHAVVNLYAVNSTTSATTLAYTTTVAKAN